MTSDDLYAIGMESETACRNMAELCRLAGVPYPPKLQQDARKNIPDPLKLEGEPA